jgi:membrane protein implicated in regulation of membrane protease activity
MADSTVWWLVAAAMVGLELVTGSFFLLMLALGMAAGAVATHMGLGVPAQLIAAGAVGGGAVVLWQRWRKVPVARSSADVNLDVGQAITVPAWAPDGTARVRYRGADWTVQLEVAEPTHPAGLYRIVAVEGSRLVVRAAPPHSAP